MFQKYHISSKNVPTLLFLKTSTEFFLLFGGFVFFVPLYLVKLKVFDFLLLFILKFYLAVVDLDCCVGFSVVSVCGLLTVVALLVAEPGL